MGLKKCPICELNYIEEQNEMCDICRRARKGADSTEDYAMCVVCGEHPAVSDLGLCSVCLYHREVLSDNGSESSDTIIDPVGTVAIDSGLESMELPMENGDVIPESEYRQIAMDLELDADEGDESDDDEYSDAINMEEYVDLDPDAITSGRQSESKTPSTH